MTSTRLELTSHDRRDTLKCEIAAEVLRTFGLLRLQVTGHSMLPAVWPADTLVVEQCTFADVVPGNIVLYSRQQRFFAHRVLSTVDTTGNPRLIVQGDALPKADAPVTSGELLGRVTAIIRDGQPIPTSAEPTLGTRCVARVLRHTTSLSRLFIHLRMKRGDAVNREVICQA